MRSRASRLLVLAGLGVALFWATGILGKEYSVDGIHLGRQAFDVAPSPHTKVWFDEETSLVSMVSGTSLRIRGPMSRIEEFKVGTETKRLLDQMGTPDIDDRETGSLAWRLGSGQWFAIRYSLNEAPTIEELAIGGSDSFWGRRLTGHEEPPTLEREASKPPQAAKAPDE